MNIELIISHGGKLFSPAVLDGITWKTECKCFPGTLEFSVLSDSALPIGEGDGVLLKSDGKQVFSGFVFTLKRSGGTVSVIAYDQLRYLKNKDTYVYENKTASEVVSMIAKDFQLKTGVIENTGCRIASRVESNRTLFDIIQSALDITYQNTNETFVLFDDAGKLTLRNVRSRRRDIVIDESTAGGYDYSSSVDLDTYNKIKLTFDNKKSGTRDVYIAQSAENIARWGVLQYYGTLGEGENGAAKADSLLKLYNSETRGLSVLNAFGDCSVNAGCLVPVILRLDDADVRDYMLVEKCRHVFQNGAHFMDLTLKGGEFIA